MTTDLIARIENAAEGSRISPERKAIFEGLREAMGPDAFKIFADMLITTAKKAKREGMMEAAAIVWDDLPEMERKRLGKTEKLEKALRLQIRDEIIERAADAEAVPRQSPATEEDC
jgi:hypothetical protein